MNDFLCKSVQYSGSRKGWPRKRKLVVRYGGSRWYRGEWFGEQSFLKSSWSERSIRSLMVMTQSTYPNRLRQMLIEPKTSKVPATDGCKIFRTYISQSIDQWCLMHCKHWTVHGLQVTGHTGERRRTYGCTVPRAYAKLTPCLARPIWFDLVLIT